MSVKRLMLAGGALALLTSSANAALTFSLVRVASNAGAAGPSTVLLVAKDPDATAPVNVAGLTGTFSDTTSNNGLKFYVPDTDAGDVDTTGGVNNTGFGVDASGNSLRKPLILGSFLDVPSRTAVIIRGTDPNGNLVEASNDPRFQSGMKSTQFISTRTNNTTMSVAALKSADGAVLGAAVVGSAGDTVTFTNGSVGSVNPADPTQAAPDIVIPNLSTADVPEPMALGFLGVVGAGTLLRRRRHANA